MLQIFVKARLCYHSRINSLIKQTNKRTQNNFYFSALNPLLITLALIGKSCVTGAFGTAYQLSAEIYPTVVRNAGMGSSSAVARVGSMLSPYIAKSVSVLILDIFNSLLSLVLAINYILLTKLF